MKKTLSSLGILITLASCSKNEVQPIPVREETKTIEFKISPAADYNHSAYNGATAEVKLSVHKQFNDPYAIQIIWDTVISRQALSNYMQLPNPYIITKRIEGVQPNKFSIGVSYSIGYISAPPANAPSMSAFGVTVPQGNQVTHQVEVNL